MDLWSGDDQFEHRQYGSVATSEIHSYAIKAYKGGVAVYIHSFLISAIGGGG